ncbi:MAG: FAD-dependent oxidoreductase, partial [Deltaproteobacteria bacterium]|nr:FAD-dependent oxidoreductase [Deltaproteobacteria bacterium]
MGENKHIGPDSMKQYSYKELPIGDVGVGFPTQQRKTGLWRYVRPEFEAKIPPCQHECPLGNWITGFLGSLDRNTEADAWDALILENPFPGVCGRACYHFCESGCNRAEIDSAVSIQAVERYLADRFADEPFVAPNIRENQGKKIAVVGAGPAGLSCAYFATILGYAVTVFEATDVLGGVPGKAVPEYRLPLEVYGREIDNVLSMGVEVRKGCRIGTDVTMDELRKDYDAVFVAIGAGVEIGMQAPGADGNGIYGGVDFLVRAKRRDAPALGESVAVIGGGNTAMDASRT